MEQKIKDYVRYLSVRILPNSRENLRKFITQAQSLGFKHRGGLSFEQLASRVSSETSNAQYVHGTFDVDRGTYGISVINPNNFKMVSLETFLTESASLLRPTLLRVLVFSSGSECRAWTKANSAENFPVVSGSLTLNELPDNGKVTLGLVERGAIDKATNEIKIQPKVFLTNEPILGFSPPNHWTRSLVELGFMEVKNFIEFPRINGYEGEAFYDEDGEILGVKYGCAWLDAGMLYGLHNMMFNEDSGGNAYYEDSPIAGCELRSIREVTLSSGVKFSAADVEKICACLNALMEE
jgi:hypothetical protein